jgi:hypothetical protein
MRGLQLFNGWPADEWIDANRKQVLVGSPFDCISLDRAKHIRESLEGSVKTILLASPAFKREHGLALDSVLLFLRSIEHDLFKGDAVLDHLFETRRGGSQFKALEMLHLLFCAAGVKDYSNLSHNLWHGLRAVLPSGFSKALPDKLTLKARLPSAATLSRYQLFADVAFMQWLRREPLEDVAYWSLDSSPQGGRDWLLSQRSSVVGDLCNTYEAVVELATLPLTEASPRHICELTAKLKSAPGVLCSTKVWCVCSWHM